MFHVLFNPPCVLHMHMRISIKILSVLFRIGLDNALSGDLDTVLFPVCDKKKPSQKQRFEKYINNLEKVMNTCVLGDPFFPTTWKPPVDEKERKFFPLKMDNQRCKRCITNIKALVELCVLKDDNKQEQFLTVVKYFQETMDFLCKKSTRN